MSTSIYINLPVTDLGRAKRFFAGLGFSFDERFADENMEAVKISEYAHVLLQTEPHFQTFIKKPIADATAGTEVILTLGADSRQEVDELADKALTVGGRPASDPIDLGFVYSRSFQDPDGHHWEVTYTDMSAAPPA
jgi:predicted lactoylglutathione lyase